MVPQGGGKWGKQLALRPSNGVYKQHNCVPGAVITTMWLFQYMYAIILSLAQQSKVIGCVPIAWRLEFPRSGKWFINNRITPCFTVLGLATWQSRVGLPAILLSL